MHQAGVARRLPLHFMNAEVAGSQPRLDRRLGTLMRLEEPRSKGSRLVHASGLTDGGSWF